MRIDHKTLDIGDEYWESSQYGNVHCRVLTAPVVDQIEIEGRHEYRYRWTATDIDTDETLNYTITDTLEHYGPGLYTEPMYVNIG